MCNIDETIKRIETDLAENEERPLPKAAPTQHHINVRPAEMSIEDDMGHILYFAMLPGVDVMPMMQRLGMLSVQVRGLDHEGNVITTTVATQPEWCFEIRCKQCGFRYRHKGSNAYDLGELGHTHADRNNHEVLFAFHYGEHEVSLTLLPVKWSWWRRFFKSKWYAVTCLFFIPTSIWSVFNAHGFWRWYYVGLVVIWIYYLYSWGKAKKSEEN